MEEAAVAESKKATIAYGHLPMLPESGKLPARQRSSVVASLVLTRETEK